MKKIILLLALITLTSMTGCQKKEATVAAANNNEVESSTNLEEEASTSEEPKEEAVEKSQEDNAEAEKEENTDSKEDNAESNKESNSKENTGKAAKQEVASKTESKSNTSTSNAKSNNVSSVNNSNKKVQSSSNNNVVSEAEKARIALDQRYASIVNTGYAITLNGVSYTMPFEYQKMMNNNWLEYDLNLRNNTISTNIKVRNGNRTVGINLQNITNSYLIYSRCLVTGIVVDRNDAASGTSIVLPKNITMNSTKDDVVSAYGQSGFLDEEGRKYILSEGQTKSIIIRFDESLDRIEKIEIYNSFC